MITLPFATILFVTSQTSIHRPNPPSTSDSLSLKGGALGVGEASQAHRKKSKLGARLLLGTPPLACRRRIHGSTSEQKASGTKRERSSDGAPKTDAKIHSRRQRWGSRDEECRPRRLIERRPRRLPTSGSMMSCNPLRKIEKEHGL